MPRMTLCPSTKGKTFKGKDLAPVCSHERRNPAAISRNVHSCFCSTFCTPCQLCSPNHSPCPSMRPPRERSPARGLQEGVPLHVDWPEAQGLLLFFVAVRTRRRWLKWELCFQPGSQVLGQGCSHGGPADPLHEGQLPLCQGHLNPAGLCPWHKTSDDAEW